MCVCGMCFSYENMEGRLLAAYAFFVVNLQLLLDIPMIYSLLWIACIGFGLFLYHRFQFVDTFQQQDMIHWFGGRRPEFRVDQYKRFFVFCIKPSRHKASQEACQVFDAKKHITLTVIFDCLLSADCTHVCLSWLSCDN